MKNLLIVFILMLHLPTAFAGEVKEFIKSIAGMTDSPKVNIEVDCNEKYAKKECPVVLTKQIAQAYTGGILGYILNSSLSFRDIVTINEPISAVKVCQGIGKFELRKDISPDDFEKYLSEHPRFGNKKLLSESFPYCLQQFDNLPDSDVKKKLLLSQYYLSDYLMEQEERGLLQSLANYDALITDNYLSDIDCFKQFSSKQIQKECKEFKLCPRVKYPDKEKQLQKMTQGTFKALKVIKGATRILALNRNDLTAKEKEVLSDRIRQKELNHPWIKGQNFRDMVRSEESRGALTQEKMQTLIKRQIQISRKNTFNKLKNVSGVHYCLQNEGDFENCQDLDKSLINLQSFKGYKKELNAQSLQGKKNQEAMTIYYMKKTQCLIEQRNEEVGANEFALDLGISTGLTIMTGGVGLFAKGANTLRTAFIAGSLGFNTAFATVQSSKAYDICQSEVKKFQEVSLEVVGEEKKEKAEVFQGYCPVVNNQNIQISKQKLNTCLSEASIFLSLGVAPFLAQGLAPASRSIASLVKKVKHQIQLKKINYNFNHQKPRVLASASMGELELAKNIEQMTFLDNVIKNVKFDRPTSTVTFPELLKALGEKRVKELNQNPLFDLSKLKEYLEVYKRNKMNPNTPGTPGVPSSSGMVVNKNFSTVEEYDEAVAAVLVRQAAELLEEQQNAAKLFKMKQSLDTVEIPAYTSVPESPFDNINFGDLAKFANKNQEFDEFVRKAVLANQKAGVPQRRSTQPNTTITSGGSRQPSNTSSARSSRDRDREGLDEMVERAPSP